MQFSHKYGGQTAVANSGSKMGISFAPDLLRKPTFFVGQLNKKIAFREAMSALHSVVVSDLRFQPRDKTAYLEWAKTQEQIWLAEYTADLPEIKQKVELVKQKLGSLRAHRNQVFGPFHQAQREFRQYMMRRNYDAMFIFDPVITVHPDELFFECFSQDESTYARLGCDYNVFDTINRFSCGTTNIDYSSALYNEFQKIRTYKATEFKIDPTGFEVKTENEDDYKEEKIDLPDSWVRGFLQVSTAMTLPAVSLDLHPMDLWNCLFILRKNKAKTSPRYLKFILEPGKPIKLLFAPWNKEIVCPRSIYMGNEAREIKIWGRRRLLTLERLLPIAQNVKIHLLGDGLPSFFIVKMDDMNFTLGLSGWTKNDWSHAGQFNLMGATQQFDTDTKATVYQALKQNWVATSTELAQKTGLDKATVHSIMTIHAQEGNAIFDLNKQQYRARELSKEGIPVEKLRFVSEVEKTAHELLKAGEVGIYKHEMQGDLEFIDGHVNREYHAQLHLNEDKKLVKATCNCSFIKQNGLRKGPCAHLLAVRMKAKV